MTCTTIRINVDRMDFAELSKLDEAVRVLKEGGIVAFPTETVYGLAANALDASAVQRIFDAKGRPSDNPLIVHVSSLDMLHMVTEKMPEVYDELVNSFWPGPLTVLMPRGPRVPDIVTAGHRTVAVRIPAHPVALALIAKCGFPIAAPSANTSGRPSPTNAEHVVADLASRVDGLIVLDGGPCQSGVESTVLDGISDRKVILRPGGVTVEQIRTVRGFERAGVYKRYEGSTMESNPTTPGMKYKHYSPDAQVILFETGEFTKLDNELTRILSASDVTVGILRSGSNGTRQHNERVIETFLGVDAESVAQNLFRGLRDLEKAGCKVILVEGISDDGVGLAVMNRLRKAASMIIQ